MPLSGGLARALVLALTAALVSLVPTPAHAAVDDPGWYYPVAQTRVVDSRSGLGIGAGKVGPGVATEIQVGGAGGVPASGAAAVDLLVTATAPTTTSGVTVWPAGTIRPPTPALTALTRQTVTTTVTVALSDSGTVAVHNEKGSTHLVVAVLGWYAEQPGDVATGQGFIASDPRLVASTFTGTNTARKPIAPRTTRTVRVAGKGGVPAAADTAVLGLLVKAGRKPTTVTAYGASQPKPDLATLVVPRGRTRTISLPVALGTGSQDGRVKLTAAGGPASVEVTNQGSYTNVDPGDALRLTPLQPALLADTTSGFGVPRGAVRAKKSVAVEVAGRAGVPASGAEAVVVSIRTSRPTKPTKVTAYRDGARRPAQPMLAPGAGETVTTRAVLVPSDAGRIRLYNAAGSVHLQVFVEGWYGAKPTPPAPDPLPLPGSVVEAAKALTTGTNPRQTGVAPGTLHDEHVAILSGSLVASGSDAPLADAVVRVVDHPEFGQTRTDSTGSYAMAVNGGGALNVEVVGSGHLPVQRWVEPTWLSWVTVEQMAATPLDPAATAVSQDATEIQPVQGSEETDAAGTRQTTLLFEPGTTATLTLPDGSEKPAPAAMTVRATEYTTGPNGQSAMPGLLPSNTGYTYASEFSVDEALAEGATSVEFSRPVPTYVTNFLNLPAGTLVPAGYYDRELGQWVAGPNGVVLDVLTESGGTVTVDVTGDGVADTGSVLSDIGLDAQELATLAELYQPGDSLTRVAVEHFTPWDYNYPYGPPAGAGGGPGGPGGGGGDGSGDPGQGEKKKRPCQSGGSIILCESRVLQEDLPVAGSPVSLRYSSEDVPGRLETRQIRIPLCNPAVSTKPADIKVTVSVAGQVVERHFDGAGCPAPWTFTWDGKDAVGNTITGLVTANVTVGYGYKFEYKEPQEFSQSFAQFGTGTLFTRSGAVATRPELSYIENTWTAEIGFRDRRAEGLGGWGLAQVHRYDTEQRVLELGDGRSVSAADPLAATISTLAGTGQQGSFAGEGPATETDLGVVRGVAVAPDGTVYFADTSNSVVRKVTPAGDVQTVAGGGQAPDGVGDGRIATEAELEAPWDLAVAPDGGLFIADAAANRIRKVSPSGVISTVAGGGFPDDGIGDGIDGRNAALSNPRGVALTPEGSLYIADTGHQRVRVLNPDGSMLTIAGGGTPADGVGDGLLGIRAALQRPVDVAVVDKRLLIADALADRVRVVALDGTISTFAGNGETGAAVDGRPATESPLSGPSGVAASEDGTVYIADRLHNRVRRVDPSGIMTTAVGTGDGPPSWDDIGDGGLGARAVLANPEAIAMSPGGQLVVADSGHFRIRTVASALPGSGATAYFIPDPDGSKVYEFDADGRHLRTRDATTGITQLAFQYGANGLLGSVTDGNGQTTTLARDGSGNVTSITAPGGRVTTLGRDADGWLASVTDPAGATTQLTHGGAGLLTTLTDRAGGVHQFSYDPDGHLIRDTNPAGGFQQLVATTLPRGTEVELVANSGRTRVVRLTTSTDGVVHRVSTDADGATTAVDIAPDGTITTTAPNGSVTVVEQQPDPRWGGIVQVPSTITYTPREGTPDQRTFDYDVELTNAANPFSLVRSTTAVTGAGADSTTTYEAATRTTTATGPDGVPEVTKLDAAGRVVSVQRGTQAPTTYTWSGTGLLTAATQAPGTTAERAWSWTYGADRHLTSMTDPLDNVTQYVTDAVGRITRITYPDGGVEERSYDGEGNPTGVTPPGRAQHRIERTQGRVTRYDAPGGAANDVGYAFTADGQAASSTSGVGTTTISRDALGRQTTITGPGTDLRFGYTDRLLTSVSNQHGADVSLAHDGNDLLSGYTWSGPVSGRVTSATDALFQVTAVRVNDAPAIGYQWNATGTLSSADGISFQYGAQALPTRTQAGTVVATVARNQFDEPTRVHYQASAATLLDDVTTRDELGRIATRTETVQGVTTSYAYTYDPVGRLTKVTAGGATVEEYAYDRNGNRTSVLRDGTMRSVTSNGLDQVTASSGVTYSYDAAGRRVGRSSGGTSSSYDWTYDGVLKGVTSTGGADVTYVLDGLGHRVARSVDGVRTGGFLYDAQDHLVATTDADGAVSARFSYAPGQVAPIGMRKDGKLYQLVVDQLGSVRLVVDTATGEVAQRLDYDSFGRVTHDTSPGFQPFGFGGGIYDHETGLVRFQLREYDAESGAWLAPDRIGFSGGDSNLYAYVANDPVNAVDPTGAFGWPNFDMPDIKLPSLGCLKSIASTTVEVLSLVPGPVGMVATGVGLAGKCMSASGCSKTDIALAGMSLVPGGAIASKGFKHADKVGYGVDLAQAGMTGWGAGATGTNVGTLAADVGGW